MTDVHTRQPLSDGGQWPGPTALSSPCLMTTDGHLLAAIATIATSIAGSKMSQLYSATFNGDTLSSGYRLIS